MFDVPNEAALLTQMVFVLNCADKEILLFLFYPFSSSSGRRWALLILSQEVTIWMFLWLKMSKA